MIELGMFVGVIFIGVFLAWIPIAVFYIVHKMAATPRLDLKPELAPVITTTVNRKFGAFLAANGFTFANAYQFHNLRLGHWVQTGNCPMRCFSILLGPVSSTYEFITKFSDEHSLTTTRTRAAFMFPRPFGGFLQSFPKASIEELLDLHTRGEHYLISTLSIPVKECRLSFLEGFAPAVLRQIRCIKSHPLWPIRGIYWFLVKRFLMVNRPIWTQNVPKFYKQIA